MAVQNRLAHAEDEAEEGAGWKVYFHVVCKMFKSKETITMLSPMRQLHTPAYKHKHNPSSWVLIGLQAMVHELIYHGPQIW